MKKGAREPFKSYRDKLAQAGFRPSRSMGQNFLVDPALNRYIADSLGARSEDLILEIGPGLGFLTRELAERARRVLAVELDGRLEALLRTELGAMPAGDRVTILHGDILGGGGRLNPVVLASLEAALAEAPGGRFLVGANLPYAIAGPCLAALVIAERMPSAMILMLQAELAERLVSPPGCKAYGSLTVLLGSLYEVKLCRRVGPEVFRPRPRVGSAIVRLEQREGVMGGLNDSAGRVGYARFLRWAFAARRKKLRGSLSQSVSGLAETIVLEALGSHGDQRAGEIAVDDWPQLWQRVCPGIA